MLLTAYGSIWKVRVMVSEKSKRKHNQTKPVVRGAGRQPVVKDRRKKRRGGKYLFRQGWPNLSSQSFKSLTNLGGAKGRSAVRSPREGAHGQRPPARARCCRPRAGATGLCSGPEPGSPDCPPPLLQRPATWQYSLTAVSYSLSWFPPRLGFPSFLPSFLWRGRVGGMALVFILLKRTYRATNSCPQVLRVVPKHAKHLPTFSAGRTIVLILVSSHFHKLFWSCWIHTKHCLHNIFLHNI